MDHKKKEETSFTEAKIKACQTTVQAVRNLLSPEATMKFGWAGQAISNRWVPMYRVPDLVITRSLDAKGRAPMKGKRVRIIEDTEDSSDEDLLDIGQKNRSCLKKKSTDCSKEEYVSFMMSKLKQRVATEMDINIDELEYKLEGKRTPPASTMVSLDPGKSDE